MFPTVILNLQLILIMSTKLIFLNLGHFAELIVNQLQVFIFKCHSLLYHIIAMWIRFDFR